MKKLITVLYPAPILGSLSAFLIITLLLLLNINRCGGRILYVRGGVQGLNLGLLIK